MNQRFLVETNHEPESDRVSIVVECNQAMVPVALDVARMQLSQNTAPAQLQEGAIAPPLAPSQQLHDLVDAEWRDRSNGPALPNLGGY